MRLWFYNKFYKKFYKKYMFYKNSSSTVKVNSHWLKRKSKLCNIWLEHCVKSVQIRSFFWSVFSCIRIEYRKIRTRKYSVFGHFSPSGRFLKFLNSNFRFLSRYYISLMDAANNLTYITSYYIYSKLLMILFSN